METVHPTNPLVSVVTIVRDCAGTVEATLESVLGQSYPRIEYIVVDGGSTDGTVEIVRRYAPRLARWVSEPDRGISDALNKGARLAQGDLILYMNAGDTFADASALERAAAAIATITADHPSLKLRETIFYGEALFVNGASSLRLAPDHARLREESILCHQSTLIGADLQKANPYDERFAIAMDYDLWLRCLGRYDFVKLPVLISHFAAGGVSSSDRYMVRLVIERAIARILNRQRAFNFQAVAELFRELVIITGKLRLKRLAGPAIYGNLKTALGR
jgi:glycosyltransferase involved in cell wall biosynthesis